MALGVCLYVTGFKISNDVGMLLLLLLRLPCWAPNIKCTHAWGAATWAHQKRHWGYLLWKKEGYMWLLQRACERYCSFRSQCRAWKISSRAQAGGPCSSSTSESLRGNPRRQPVASAATGRLAFVVACRRTPPVQTCFRFSPHTCLVAPNLVVVKEHRLGLTVAAPEKFKWQQPQQP